MKKITIILLLVFFASLLFLIKIIFSHLFIIPEIVEPAEYGVFIREIHNKSDENVIFINLLESKHYVVKPQKQEMVNSWLAASDYEKPGLFSSALVGSITKKSNRSILIITKKGLFYLNLGRFHSFKTGPDLRAQIWVLNEQSDTLELKPIKGWSLVEKIGAYDDGSRILLITQDGNVEARLSQQFETQQSPNESISTAADFFHYLYALKQSKSYKKGYPR